MSTATVSRWAQVFLLVSAVCLVAAQIVTLAGFGRRTAVVLGLYGFVLLVVFGKAYSLVPSYFERDLVWPRAMGLHLAFAVLGIVALALDPILDRPAALGTLGALAWAGSVFVFVLTVGVTIRDNLTGTDTGTGGANEDRRALDRFANAFVPVALAYLAVGTYELLAAETPLPVLVGSAPAQVTHLLAAGFALVMLFAIGTRLLPRFLVASPPPRLTRAVLPAGAIAPLLLSAGYPTGRLFQAGAVLEAFAVVGFAVVYAVLFYRSGRDRVGLYGPLFGVALGVVGVALGIWFAVAGFGASLTTAHLRLNLFGLLGVSIVGVLYQFYPPAIADWPFTGDRLAFWTLVVLSVGVLTSAIGATTVNAIENVGTLLIAGAGVGHVYLLAGTIWTGTRR